MNDTPEPWNLPEGVHLTTLGAVRALDGEWEANTTPYHVKHDDWREVGLYNVYSRDTVVFARRKPEPLVAVLLPRSEVERIARSRFMPHGSAYREALARHDGAQP